MAIIGNIEKGIININYKVIIKVLIEVYFKVIIKRSIMFIRSQITNQLNTPLISKRRYIISFIKIQKMLKTIRSPRPTFKTF